MSSSPNLGQSVVGRRVYIDASSGLLDRPRLLGNPTPSVLSGVNSEGDDGGSCPTASIQSEERTLESRRTLWVHEQRPVYVQTDHHPRDRRGRGTGTSGRRRETCEY